MDKSALLGFSQLHVPQFQHILELDIFFRLLWNVNISWTLMGIPMSSMVFNTPKDIWIQSALLI